MKPRKKLNESFNDDNKSNETIKINSTDTSSSSVSTINDEPSVITDSSGGAEQASVHPENATTQQRRIDLQRVQNVLLIWLDNNIDDNSADCRNTIKQLRRAVNDINTFTNADQCIDFLTDIHIENVCMLISGSLCQNIISLIHDITQLHTVFIFSTNQIRHEQWIKEWSKIKGVFTDISPICEALKQTAQHCEQNAISISFVATSGIDDVSEKNLDQLDPIFMYSQILKEILLTIKFGDEHIEEYINYCGTVFSENDEQLSKVNRLKIEYHMKTPIWWYTWESFLYPMLNYTLRSMNMDIIIKMGFFIKDLHRQIEKLHSEQFNGGSSNQLFTAYRGQGMTKNDFDKMTKIQGGLMSFNNLLSTSKDRQVSLFFAESNRDNPDLVGILFVMTIDPDKSTTPFASIIDVGYYGDQEDEVLFSMHTVFRIGDITPMDETQRLFQVNLTLTSDNDKDLRILTDRIRQETYPDAKGWCRLGSLLLKVGESAKAQQVYETLLEQTTDIGEKGGIIHLLAWTKNNQGEYEEAITFYEKALEIYKNTLSPTHLNLASCYNDIGGVYYHMGDYQKAVSYFEKDLEILQQSLPSNHPDLAGSYNNMGGMYFTIGDYPKAVSYYKKVLEISKQSLPSNHPQLGMSYNNIGLVYFNIGDYSNALSSHEKALEIRQQSLPSNHPDLGGSYNNIGNVYSNMGDYSKALSYYEKALEIKQQLLPSHHPDLGGSYNNIGFVHFNMGDYPKALSYYEKALEIKKQSLPSNHLSLAISYGHIGNVYDTMGESSKALSFCQRAVDIAEQSLPSNHSHLQWYRNNLDRVTKKL